MARTKQTKRRESHLTSVERRKRTHSWLKFNRLVDDTSDNVLIKCIDKITDVLGGTKQLLKIISSTVKLDVLNTVHQTLITEKIKHQNNKSNLLQNNECEYDNDINMNQNVFLWLPNECISHICGYLKKYNIESFKFASRQIAIVCLEEMNKISILTYNTNNLIENSDINLNQFTQNIVDLSQKTRHNPKKRYHSLIDQWSKQYNIPEHNLLVCSCPVKISRLSIIKIEKLDSNIKTNNMKHKTLLICDNRHFVVVDNKHVAPFDVSKHKYDVIKHYNVLILEYFDIMTQSINNIQFIIYDKSVNVFETINKYIACTNINNVCHSKLHHIMKQMHDDTAGKLKIYFHHRTGMKHSHHKIGMKMRDQSGCCHLCTFQLNKNNEWFKTTNALNDIKAKCEDGMVEFQSNAKTFCENIGEICININNYNHAAKIISCIEHYYNTQLNNEEADIYKYDLNRIVKILKKRVIKLTFNKSYYPTVLRCKIMQIFANIIDAKFIELHAYKYKETLLKPKYPIWRNFIKGDKTFDCGCFLVLYDVNSLPGTYNTLYQVRIFIPSINPHPFHKKEDALWITIKYKKQFTVKEFADYLFNLIFQSKNHILYDIYKHLLDVYYDMNSIDEANSMPSIKDNISCMMATNTRRGDVKRLFSYNDTVNRKDLYNNRIDFHTIETKPDDLLRNVKLTIKFKSKASSKRCGFTEIGIPLNIWIDTEDTLEYIINKFFNKISKYIHRIYRVITNNNEQIKQELLCPYCKKQIPENQYHEHLSACLNNNHKNSLEVHRNYRSTVNKQSEFDGELLKIEEIEYEDYKPFYEFIASYPNDILLIQFNSKCPFEFDHYTNEELTLLSSSSSEVDDWHFGV